MRRLYLGLTFAFAVLATLCGTPQARAEIRPSYSIRWLVIESADIVLAAPLDGGPGKLPLQYQVLEVLAGKHYADGEKIRIGGDGLPELGPHPFNSVRGSKHSDPPEIQVAVLFVWRQENGIPPLPDGAVRAEIRALTMSGDVLVPSQVINPGPLYLQPKKDLKWEDVIAKIRADVPLVRRVRGLLAMNEPPERNAAILNWIQDHKPDLAGPNLFEQENGWGRLKHELLEAIYQSCIPEDCWRAVELSVKFDDRAIVYPSPSFCSPDGRSILLTHVLNKEDPVALRRQALELLAESCHASPNRSHPNVTDATEEECMRILKEVLPLIQDDDNRWRSAAVSCVHSACSGLKGSSRGFVMERVVPELAQRYLQEEHSHVRGQLGDALIALGGKEYWEKLTGNPDGIAIVVSLANYDSQWIEFRLGVQPAHVEITLPVSLRMERLGDDDQTLETIEVSPEIRSYARSRQAPQQSIQYGDGVLAVPTAKVPKGRWRVSAEGKTADGETWRSGPTVMSIPREE